MRGEWHKIAALIMVKQGLTELDITLSDIAKMARGDVNIVVHDRGDRLVVKILDDKAAQELARKQGGRLIDN